MTIEEIIQQYRDTQPTNNPPQPSDVHVMRQKLFTLTQPHNQFLINHYKDTPDGKKVKEFVDKEIAKIVKFMGIDESTVLSDIINQLTLQDVSLQDEVLEMAMDEVEKEKG